MYVPAINITLEKISKSFKISYNEYVLEIKCENSFFLILLNVF